MSKEQTPIERLEKKMKSFAMKSYQYNELNALIQEIKTEREQYAQAKVLEALEREAVDIYFAVRKGCTRDPFKTTEEHAKNYIETEVKPRIVKSI